MVILIATYRKIASLRMMQYPCVLAFSAKMTLRNILAFLRLRSKIALVPCADIALSNRKVYQKRGVK